jgi:hypothetical protein
VQKTGANIPGEHCYGLSWEFDCCYLKDVRKKLAMLHPFPIKVKLDEVGGAKRGAKNVNPIIVRP